MSYDLALPAPGLDTERARAALLERHGVAGDGDELVWPLAGLVAQFLLSTDGLDVGVVGQDADPETRARDFRALLEWLLELGERLGAPLYDEQWDRVLTREDLDEVVADFA